MFTVPEPPTPVSTTTARSLWDTAVCLAATKARAALPHSNGRIDKAMQLVLDGAVELLDDHSARVTSQHDGETRYFVVNGTCECPDFARAPQHWCKHRLARALTVKAMQIAKTLGAAEGTITVTPEVTTPNPSEAAHPSAPLIPPQFLVTIQGKPFITFQGLLHLATQQGAPQPYGRGDARDRQLCPGPGPRGDERWAGVSRHRR